MMKNTLNIRLPNCETLKLKMYRPQHLYHIDWHSTKTLKRLEIDIDDFEVTGWKNVHFFMGTIGKCAEANKLEWLVIHLKTQLFEELE
jgi:hypothetical protein